jgi:very-short-patch-repair endonuclease
LCPPAFEEYCSTVPPDRRAEVGDEYVCVNGRSGAPAPSVGGCGETGVVSFFPSRPSPWGDADELGRRPPAKVSTRTFSAAIEEALMHSFTRAQLEVVLSEELGLVWGRDDVEPQDTNLTKRALVDGYIKGWSVPEVAAFARRLDTEVEIQEYLLPELRRLVEAHERGGGVEGTTKNLIFAANGPKPEIVLRDAVSNDIEIVANAEYCLVYDRPVPPEGVRFSHLVQWWRDKENIPAATDDRTVGLRLHQRFLACLDSPAERVVFEAYASRYKNSFDIPALIPQVYLHYDPYDRRTRKASANGTPLARQRMDFLLIFSDRKRVVVEVDGKQHYADGSIASPSRYSEMVAEDRRLRLAGYEVYRFGGYELTQNSASTRMVQDFFEQLADRMK